ncbi:MAG TPA: hypothetical protein VGB93_07905 [Methylovirgula sp.]
MNLNYAPLLDIDVLADLGALASLDMCGAEMIDLSPLANHPRLSSLDLGGASKIDLEPLTDCQHLSKLNLWGTIGIDISPLARMTSLADAAQARRGHSSGGVSAARSDFGQHEPVAGFGRLSEPRRTVELINYLRQQQGLAPYYPPGYSSV